MKDLISKLQLIIAEIEQTLTGKFGQVTNVSVEQLAEELAFLKNALIIAEINERDGIGAIDAFITKVSNEDKGRGVAICEYFYHFTLKELIDAAKEFEEAMCAFNEEKLAQLN